MINLFQSVLNMSITASYIALAIILVRLLLKKTPKIFSYVLWIVVLFRLVCPFSFSSTLSFLSLMNSQNSLISQNIGVIKQTTVDTNINGINTVMNNSVNNIMNNSVSSTKSMATSNSEVSMSIAAYIWLAIIGIVMIYCIVSYLKIKRRVNHATLVNDNIFETDMISTPFVLGFIRPKIYIPSNITQEELPYVLEHEQTHIKRLDYLIKPFAFLILTLHWFNPLMWLCYSLMSKDMEMSCDERVMKLTSGDIRGDYSKSLLSLSAKQSGLLNPLAFGESNVKSRIKNVLNYKRPTFWISAVALISVCVIAVCLISNTVNYMNDKAETTGLPVTSGTVETIPKPINAGDLVSDDYYYQLRDNGTNVSIMSYKGAGGDVKIPSKIDGKYVTSIGKHAFSQNLDPNYLYPKITTVTIPLSVTVIFEYAFASCGSLTQINVEGNNASFTSIDGVLFSKDKTVLIKYPEGKTSASYTIPDNVTSIGSAAFFPCSKLNSIIIPSSVSSIEESAFSGSGLTTITIPNSVTLIGNGAFYGCEELSTAILPDNLSSIGEKTFQECKSLTTITIPNSVTSIGTLAFGDCTSLTNITIPNSVTSIGNAAFASCTKLTNITIPKSVESIGANAFSRSKLFTINGEVNSFAQQFATENKIPFVITK